MYTYIYNYYNQGDLLKQGHFVRNWKRRTFVLTYGELAYYNGKKMKGMVATDDVEVARKISGRKRAIELVTAKKTYTLEADTAEVADEWIAAINDIVIAKELVLKERGSILSARYGENKSSEGVTTASNNIIGGSDIISKLTNSEALQHLIKTSMHVPTVSTSEDHTSRMSDDSDEGTIRHLYIYTIYTHTYIQTKHV